MKYGLKENEQAANKLLTLLDDLMRQFLLEHPGAAVLAEVTLLQRVDSTHVDVSHAWGEWEPGDGVGAGLARGMCRVASPPPTRAERRASKRMVS